MTDFDTIWRQQDEIRTVVNAVLGEGVWSMEYTESRKAIELELTAHLKADLEHGGDGQVLLLGDGSDLVHQVCVNDCAD